MSKRAVVGVTSLAVMEMNRMRGQIDLNSVPSCHRYETAAPLCESDH